MPLERHSDVQQRADSPILSNKWSNRWGRTGRKKRHQDPVTATSRKTQHEQKRHRLVGQTGAKKQKPAVNHCRKLNGLSTSRERYWRAEQTYQKPWKKRQLAQPLESRILRSSDHKRSRGSLKGISVIH
ncbi:hypothetical protein GOODEAATRI_033719 [Goodea atripinnis]|uniref:Uncharacterized protein n=1 Tax=Goodea atripinnis TaxID=208336 RepID=A0ABV0PJ80_9TELE